jgi:hypothetical protein
MPDPICFAEKSKTTASPYKTYHWDRIDPYSIRDKVDRSIHVSAGVRSVRHSGKVYAILRKACRRLEFRKGITWINRHSVFKSLRKIYCLLKLYIQNNSITRSEMTVLAFPRGVELRLNRHSDRMP